MSTALADRPRRTGAARYRQTLWLLTSRDLKVRYSTSALGYVWSILDPLVMAGIYFFVFQVVFKRSVGEDPYIVGGNTLTLEPGMAFSVEPGVYFDGDWGARIEDIVVVTDDGCERLNTRPRDLVVL